LVTPRIKINHSGHFNRQEHQNCSRTITGLRVTPHDTQGVEGKKEAIQIIMFCKEKKRKEKQ
jgi:hypothetical protein